MTANFAAMSNSSRCFASAEAAASVRTRMIMDTAILAVSIFAASIIMIIIWL